MAHKDKKKEDKNEEAEKKNNSVDTSRKRTI